MNGRAIAIIVAVLIVLASLVILASVLWVGSEQEGATLTLAIGR